MILFGERHRRRALREFVAHYLRRLKRKRSVVRTFAGLVSGAEQVAQLFRRDQGA
jgi:hypothetical protein